MACGANVLVMDKIEYKLEKSQFEGPLDLLLHLIAKHKLNIYDIQISEILDQYMSYINKMQSDEMEVASEFIEMAARLVYIKTVSLLPKHEEGDELKKELEGQLIEYQECKRIASVLAELINFDTFLRKPSEIDFNTEYTRSHKIQELIDAYLRVNGNKNKFTPPYTEKISQIISKKIISVNSKIIHILRKLWKVNSLEYNKIFESSKEKSELVATFLAVLELVKGKRVMLDDSGQELSLKLINSGEKHEYKRN